MDKREDIVGSYTTYYRSQMEPCLIDADECDLENMELLGFSKMDPIYLATKAKKFKGKESRAVQISSSVISRLVNLLDCEV